MKEAMGGRDTGSLIDQHQELVNKGMKDNASIIIISILSPLK